MTSGVIFLAGSHARTPVRGAEASAALAVSLAMERHVNSGQTITLHAAATEGAALCASVDFAPDARAPEWVHLLPAGRIMTADGRGPYTVPDMHQLAARSLPAGERLVIDENHATDLAAPHGQPAPARGWIVELQARRDGLWGRVEWTDEGAALVSGKAYRGISPVIVHDKAGVVSTLLRASLVNRPNLKNLATLHQESSMNLLARLIAALALDTTTSEDALVSAVTVLHQQQKEQETALQAQLAPIAKAAGLADGATAEQVVSAVGALKTGEAAPTELTALQAEIADLTRQLNTERETRLRRDAEAFVDGAIAEGRAGLKPVRDRYIALHMKDPAEAEALINAMPRLPGGRTVPAGAPPAANAAQLTEIDRELIALMGIDPKKFEATRAAEIEAQL